MVSSQGKGQEHFSILLGSIKERKVWWGGCGLTSHWVCLLPTIWTSSSLLSSPNNKKLSGCSIIRDKKAKTDPKSLSWYNEFTGNHGIERDWELRGYCKVDGAQVVHSEQKNIRQKRQVSGLGLSIEHRLFLFMRLFYFAVCHLCLACFFRLKAYVLDRILGYGWPMLSSSKFHYKVRQGLKSKKKINFKYI